MILYKQAPLREKYRPVALLRAYERQCRRAGIGHVGPDIKEVFEEPEAREGHGGSLAFPPEIGGAQERDQEFAECSAENHDGVAKPTEEKVAASVNDEIDVIDDQKTGAVGRSIEQEGR